MTDLSQIPDLELRQKVKPINDAIDKIDDEIERITAPLYVERNKLVDQLSALLDGRYIDATCAVTGLPIFGGDDTVETVSLACVDA